MDIHYKKYPHAEVHDGVRDEVRRMRLGASKNLLRLLFCLAFSIAYVFFPWDAFDIKFGDLEVYLTRIELLMNDQDGDMPDGGAGLIYYISNEILWRGILILVGTLFQEPRIGLGIISCFSLMVYSTFLIKRVNPILAVFFLLNPLFIDLILSQIRVSLAFSLLLIAALSDKKEVRIACAVAATFIHTASIVFIIFYFFFEWLLARSDRIKLRYLCIFALASGAVFSLCLAYGLDFVLALVGDRRENYVADSSSLLFSSFWFVVAIVLCMGQRKMAHQESLIFLYSISMLSVFFFSSVLNVYGSRFVAVALPLIVCSVSQLPHSYKIPVLYVFVLFQIVQWAYWI
jgi:hypothetical protein